MTSGFPTVCFIVARAPDGAIGRAGAMPWHIPEDLAFFRDKTVAKPVIFGRKTFDAILAQTGRPLRNRHIIVVSRTTPDYGPDVTVYESFPAALAQARHWAIQHGADEVMIGGGAEIYRAAMADATKAYITDVPVTVPDADAFFPDLGPEWQEISRHDAGPCVFRELQRKI
ncbi:MAG: dihydrofolate reductase [Pseudomonadota bacterium]